MKLRKRIVAAALAVLLLITFVLVGCGGNNPHSLDGTVWEVSKFVSNGKELSDTVHMHTSSQHPTFTIAFI